MAGALHATAQIGSVHATVETGVLQGVQSGSVVAFKGIPYAAAPVGALRWRDPQPAAKWQGVREASAFGFDCVQGLRNGKALEGKYAEDCLFLNVWRPAITAKNLPVMVWIHGGGFVFGGSSAHTFDGTAYAKRDVILVSINYRLGRFGFFAHPALRAEAPSDVEGNYGLMDQVAALQWIQRNIASFGGDPKTVTIFGESAGGMSVQILMTSPLTAGLFTRAIVQSGLGRPVKADSLGQPSLAVAEEAGKAFAKANAIEGNDAETLAKLRALPPEKVRDVALLHGKAYTGPMIDGKLTTGITDDVLAKGGGARIALMIGATDMDLGRAHPATKQQLFSMFGPAEAAAKSAYDPDGKADVTEVMREIGMDREMEEPARFAAKTYAARGLPVWEYRFSYVAEDQRDKVKGARHSSDNAYVFDTIGGPSHKVPAADQAMSDAMVGYWSSFGKKGDPNGDGRPVWPRYNAKSDVLMNFTDAGPKAMPDPWKLRLDAVESGAESLRKADAGQPSAGASEE